LQRHPKTEMNVIEVVQAFDRAPITALKTDDASALESKLSAAARLFADRKSWLKPFERIAILHRLSVLLEGKREHFGLQIAREGGKPLTDALIEVDRAIDGVKNAADMLRVAAGQEIPMGLTRASLETVRRDLCPCEGEPERIRFASTNDPLQNGPRTASYAKPCSLAGGMTRGRRKLYWSAGKNLRALPMPVCFPYCVPP